MRNTGILSVCLFFFHVAAAVDYMVSWIGPPVTMTERLYLSVTP